MPTMMGPPAMPKRMGVLMPGSRRGMVPRASPRMMPMKMLPMLGSSSVLTEFPKNRSALSTSSRLPTMVTRSPYCRRRLLLAKSLMSPRITRLTFTPHTCRRCRLPRRLPLRPRRVTTHTRLSTLASMAFQSIFSRFQSFFSCLPKSSMRASSSSMVVTTSSESLARMTVSGSGTMTSSPRQMRETIKWRCVICAI